VKCERFGTAPSSLLLWTTIGCGRLKVGTRSLLPRKAVGIRLSSVGTSPFVRIGRLGRSSVDAHKSFGPGVRTEAQRRPTIRAEQAPGGILWTAVVPLAMRILATSDGGWGRWEPLAKAEASPWSTAGARERRSR